MQDSRLDGPLVRPRTAALMVYFELTPNVSCPLFPGSLLLDLGHMRHLGLGCVERHFFHRESSVLAGTAI